MENLKSEKGITLIVLIITLVILLIFITTVNINISGYVEKKAYTNFETDLRQLKESIDYYYSVNKVLPIQNKYTNSEAISSIDEVGQISVNDNATYFVIDLNLLENMELNYGKDFYTIESITDDITTLEDIYIINEQSHVIYYAKGINYKQKKYFRLDEEFQKIEDYTVTVDSGATKSNDNWTNQNITITLPTKEGATTEYQKGSLNVNGIWMEYDPNNKPTIENNTRLYYRYRVGDIVSGYETLVISNIDKNAPAKPTVEIISGDLSVFDTYTSDVVIQFTYTQEAEDESGVDKMVYKLSGATTQDETIVANEGTITISNPGITTIKAYVYDNAKNISEVETITIEKEYNYEGYGPNDIYNGN